VHFNLKCYKAKDFRVKNDSDRNGRAYRHASPVIVIIIQYLSQIPAFDFSLEKVKSNAKVRIKLEITIMMS